MRMVSYLSFHYGYSAQTAEEKNFWAGLSDSAKAETVLAQVLV